MQSESGSQARAWLSHLLGSASEHAIVFLDGRGHLLAWLGAAETLFGYRKAEALQLEFADLFTPNDRRLQMDLQELAVARALGRSEDERWHVRRDGTFFWASGVVAAVKNSQGSIEAYCKVLRDRTDVRQQLDTQQNRIQALQQEHRRKTNVLESVGQQLRSMAGNLDEAARVVAGESQAAMQGRQWPAQAGRLLEMACALEDVAKSGRRGIPESVPRTKSIILQEALKACIRRVRQSHLASGHHLHLIVPSVAIKLDAEPIKLRDMLHALLANALRNTPPGGNIHIMASVEGASAVVRVADDGMGIVGRRLAKVLLILSGPDRLSKLDDADAELAAMVDLAADQGGSLEARSPGKGKGSQFCFRLPIAPALNGLLAGRVR